VYVSGSIGTGDMNDYEIKMAYWIDSHLMDVPSTSKIAHGMGLEVVDNDVYVVGFRSGEAGGICWRNGEIVEALKNVILYDIAIVDNTVFLAGDYRPTSVGYEYAYYWVNGKPIMCGINQSTATSIFVVKK
jgi:hypothetical protein